MRNTILAVIAVFVASCLIAYSQGTSLNDSRCSHATWESVAAAMKAQFSGWFIAYNRGSDSFGATQTPLCARIHPFDVSEANRNGHVPSFCAQDAHGFYDWLCFFDTTYSLANNWPYQATHQEVVSSKEATDILMWIDGPFVSAPPDPADFVFNPSSYPSWEPTTVLQTECGPIKKFNGGIVFNASVPGLPDVFQIKPNHAFTYVCGAIFDQLELTPGFWTLRLAICSSIPIRPGAPTKDSSLGAFDGWANVRAATENFCWWDRAMVIEIRDHDDNPDFCCACND